MVNPVISQRVVQLLGRGLRGETFADVARRVGNIAGVPISPAATDQEIMNALSASVSLTGANTYPDTASGIAVTTDGQSFWVADSAGLRLYRNNSGVADEIDPFTSASKIALDGGATVQDRIDGLEGISTIQGDWMQGGGRNLNTNDQVNYIAPGIDSVVSLGGRGWLTDPNRIPGSRERNSYINFNGYWRTSQTDIGGVIYDNFVLSTTLNPAANAELTGNLGGGDNFVGSLASANVWGLHCNAGLFGNHSWNVCSTYSTADGFYCGNLFGTDNQNYGNRSANIASYNCRIGVQGTDAASAVVNASLNRHSLNLCSDTSSIDTSYTFNLGSRLSGGIRDFTLNHGFGVSGEYLNGITYGWAINTRGDNQATKLLLSRTNTTGSAITLSASGDWAFTPAATAQQRTNANGSIVMGQNTQLNIIAEVQAMQKGGSGYYFATLRIRARMDGPGTATLISAVESNIVTNKSTGVPSSSWVWDVTVDATSGVVALRFKGLNGETVICNADCSIVRIRALSPAVAIVPPIPFAVLT